MWVKGVKKTFYVLFELVEICQNSERFTLNIGAFYCRQIIYQ